MNLRSHRWIVWLLPLLVARALVPTGFMWSAADGNLSLGFCPGAGPTVQITPVSNGIPAHSLDQGHAPAHHHAHAQHGSQGSTDQHSNHFGASDTGVCPFAVVATACSGCEVFVGNARVDAGSELVPFYTAPPGAHRPIRADRIRGPPSALLHA